MRQIYWLRGAVVLLLLMLAVTVAGGYVAFTFARIFFANENAVRLDPFALSTYPTSSIPRTPDLKRVVFFGDSRAESWSAPEGVSGYEFVNRGIGGQTTTQILGRFDAHLAPLQPDVVVLQLGINDIKSIPLFPDSRASIIANTIANIQRIIQQSTDLGATVIMTTIFPVSEPTIERLVFFWSDDIAVATEEVNVVLRTLASDNVLVYDVDSVLLGTDGRPRLDYMPDTLHINDAGYAALNVGLADILNSLNESP